MSKFKFELDQSGVRTEILQASWMMTAMEEVASAQGATVKKPFIGFDRAKVFAVIEEGADGNRSDRD